MHRNVATSTGGISRGQQKHRKFNGGISSVLHGNDDYGMVAELLDPGKVRENFIIINSSL